MNKKITLLALSVPVILATSAIANFGFTSDRLKSIKNDYSPTIRVPSTSSPRSTSIATAAPSYTPSTLNSSTGETGYNTGGNSGKDGKQNWTYGEGESSTSFQISTASPTPTATATSTATPAPATPAPATTTTAAPTTTGTTAATTTVTTACIANSTTEYSEYFSQKWFYYSANRLDTDTWYVIHPSGTVIGKGTDIRSQVTSVQQPYGYPDPYTYVLNRGKRYKCIQWKKTTYDTSDGSVISTEILP